MTSIIKQPFDLARVAFHEAVRVQMRGDRYIKSKLDVRFIIYWAAQTVLAAGNRQTIINLRLPIFALKSEYGWTGYRGIESNQHLNMILGDIEETLTTTDIDPETFEEFVKTTSRHILMVFVSHVMNMIIFLGMIQSRTWMFRNASR